MGKQQTNGAKQALLNSEPHSWLHWASGRYASSLRAARMQAGVRTQQELSELTGIPRQTINEIENGKAFLSIAIALRVREALECSLDDLYVRRAAPEREAARVAMLPRRRSQRMTDRLYMVGVAVEVLCMVAVARGVLGALV